MIPISNRNRAHIFYLLNSKLILNLRLLSSLFLPGSKHDILIKILRPLATRLIKQQICKAAEGGIRDGLEKLDAQLVELRDRMDAASKDPNSKQIDVLKEKFSKSDKASTSANKDGTFKFATSKRNSILPNMGHPEGWINKIEGAENAAKTGHDEKEWHSPAFSVVPGSAPKINGSA